MIKLIEAALSKTETQKEISRNLKASTTIKSRLASAFCLSAILAMAALYFQTDNVITLKLLISGIIVFGLLFIKNQQN
jgi:small-conductance mechanosensitive channel